MAKLWRNAGYLTISHQAGNLLQLLFFLYAARTFGQGPIGRYSFGFSFTYVFAVLADLGLSTYMMREIARDKSGTRKIFVRCFVLRTLALALLSSAAVLIVVLFFGKQAGETVGILVLLGLYQIFLGAADIFLAEFKGHDRMALVSLLTFVVKGLIAAAGILLLALGLDFLIVLTSFPAGALIYLGLSAALSSRMFGRIKPRLSGLDLGSLFVAVLPFASALVLIEMFYNLDILMLKFMGNDQAVGVFSAANRIVLAILGINLFIHTALLPTFSRLHADSSPALAGLAVRTLRTLGLAGLPISAGLFAVSGKVISLFYGSSFRDSVGPLNVLSWTIAIGFAAVPFSVLLTAVNRQREKVLAIAAALLIDVGANALLIPRLGPGGAAWAKTAGEGCHLILMAALAAKYAARVPILKIFLKPALGAGLMYVFIRLVPSWSLAAVIPAAAAVYALALAALRGYSPEEIGYFKGVLRKLNSEKT